MIRIYYLNKKKCLILFIRKNGKNPKKRDPKKKIRGGGGELKKKNFFKKLFKKSLYQKYKKVYIKDYHSRVSFRTHLLFSHVNPLLDLRIFPEIPKIYYYVDYLVFLFLFHYKNHLYVYN